MNTTSKKFDQYFKSFILFASILLVAKIISAMMLYFLPISGTNMIVDDEGINIQVSFRAKNVFNLKNKQPKKEIPKKKEVIKKTEVFPLDAIKLKSIYRSKSLSFVTALDAKELKFINIGDTFKGYKLLRVLSKSAIFTRGNKEYEVKLTKEDDEKFKKSVKTTKSKETKKIDTVQKKTNVTRDEIKEYKKDLNKIWSNIGIKEYKENGQFKGFIITFVKKGSVFEDLGLQKNDILLKANGIKLRSYRDAFKLYKQIDKIKVFKLVILRNNEEKELEYEIY